MKIAMKHVFLFGIFGWLLSFTLVAQTGIWQWSVPVRNFSTHPKNPESRAYLWIPGQCEQVKAILVAQHNMEEISILEDEAFRQRMAELDVAQIWVCPSFNHGFDFTDGAWETLDGLLADLAEESGYKELSTAPLIAIGHSAAASWPYYLAAYKPERTLACISVSGQWPYHRDRWLCPDIWGERNINKIPCLETMGEYESAHTWSNEGLKERKEHPLLPLSMLACPAEGHFAYTPEKAQYIALYIKNFGVLEGFLTVLIGDEIHIVEILESEGNQQTENDKFNRVDIKALNSKNEIVIIEIQNTRELYYLERILYGVAKAITEHISLGETYYKVKKIYSISILYFDIGHGTDYLYHGQNIFKGVHTGDFLQVSTREKDAIVPRMPSEIYPEYFLIRVNEFNKVAVTPLEEWIEYLKTGIIRPDTTAPGLGEAREKLKYYSMTPQERHAYDEHLSALMIQNDVLDSAKLEGKIEGKIEGRLEGRAEGREEGREEGIKEGVLRNARRMKEKGFSTEDIMEITGLTFEEVSQL